ncbi:thermonuclease family protein [Mesorhizobium sp. 10J20-29]
MAGVPDTSDEGLDLVAYTTAELEQLKTRINGALASGRLDSWQTNFLTDLKGRIEQFGVNVRLSDKQLAKLVEIVAPPESLRDIPARSVNLVFASPRPRPVPRSGYRKTYRRRRFGYRTRSWLISLKIIAVLAVVSALVDKAPSLDVSSLISTPTQSVKSSKFERSNITRSDFTIIDGDTIRVNGERKGTRLVGFNTPETIQPGCSAERALGLKAKARLRQLVSKGRLSLERIRCACKPGTEGTDACNYGRSCGVLSVDGRDVGDTLVSEGLAVRFVCGSTRCPPTPKPWCG